MNPAINLAVTSNARAYAENLRRYATETGKTLSQALAREGPDFKQELFRQFQGIHPTLGSIFAGAKARGFRVFRRGGGNELVRVAGGLSARAMSRARELLGDQKSDLFRFVGSGVAGFGLVPVRFSARRGNKRLQGGRTGWRFAKSALRAYQIPADVLKERLIEEKKLGSSVRRLNLRALAVHYELLYRERAAAGGTMAVQWMFRTWRRGGSRQQTQLVQRSVTGVPIGTVDFEFDRAGDLQGIVFRGYVPGTGQQAEKRGLLDRVFAARAPALLNAIQFHHAKLTKQRGF